MLYCQSSPGDHRAAAVHALSFSWQCGHPDPVRTLACPTHGAELRARPRAAEATPCRTCGETSPLTLNRVDDVFEERVDVTILRPSLERSVHSPVTFAYDRALRAVTERGMDPVATYRAPVRWRSSPTAGPVAADIVEATVTLAVTRPSPAVGRAG